MSEFFDQLRRMQATLNRRVLARDVKNIRSVGFAPVAAHKPDAEDLYSPVMAQFDVHRKRKSVAQKHRIEPIEPLRLLDKSTRQYDHLQLITDVEQTGKIVPTGVQIRTKTSHATTALVVRWTTVSPVPPPPKNNESQDPRWRWGVLSVSHLFGSASSAQNSAMIERNAHCGDGPEAVRGRVLARGRIPGGPDVSLIETGLDRLWLSGFLPQVAAASIATANLSQLERWTVQGATGELFIDGLQQHWTWKSFYPELAIDGLGLLQHLVQYTWKASLETDGQNSAADATSEPFGPGTSGGVLIAGGIPIGMQVAAMRPDFKIGYAQTFETSLHWLKDEISATWFEIVNVVSSSN